MQKAYRYGIEIECLVNTQTYADTSDALKALGVKYSLPHNNAKPWHNVVDVTSDSSISADGDNDGMEIRIGAVSMRTLSRLMPKVQTILQDIGDAHVNRSCGLHCHVSNRRFLTKKYLKRVIHTWLAVEDVFMRTQPRSRQHNTYALRFLRAYFESNFDTLPSKKDQIISKLSRTGRYCTLNLSSLSVHSTIENRLHSASIESKKIVNWARLLTAFYNYCLERYDSVTVNQLLKQKADSAKVNALFDLLELETDLKKYYAERIARFNYPTLETEQTALNQLLALKPEVDKKRKAYERYRRAYETVEHSFNSALNIATGR